MKKERFAGILLGLALALGMMLGMSVTAYADSDTTWSGNKNAGTHTHDGIPYTAWTDELAGQQNPGKNASNSLPCQAGNYYLTGDVTLDGTWVVPGSAGLCLDGHSITSNADSGWVIYIEDGTLDLYDKADNSGTISGGKDGGVYIENGAFNMQGGTITGNGSANASGGGVHVNFVSTFYMSGGMIRGNTGNIGGGVYVHTTGAVVISGTARIEKNIAVQSGGGVYVGGGESYGAYTSTAGRLIASGGAVIKDNTDAADTPAASNVFLAKCGGSVYEPSLNAKITFGGELTCSGPIGVAMEVPGVFTSGWKANMSGKTGSDYFTSENSGYEVQAEGDELKLADIAVEDVKAKIGALPDREKVTADDEKAIEDARTAYDALTDAQKKEVGEEAFEKLKVCEEALAEVLARIESVKTVTVNASTVNGKVLNAAIAQAGGSSKYVTTIILGKKVKKIGKGAFKDCAKTGTLVVKTKKLKKGKVKQSLKGSAVTTVKVQIGSKKVNKKFVKKYKKIFTKKNAGKKVKVTF